MSSANFFFASAADDDDDVFRSMCDAQRAYLKLCYLHVKHPITFFFFWTDGESEESKSDDCTSVFQLADLEAALSPELIIQSGGDAD